MTGNAETDGEEDVIYAIMRLSSKSGYVAHPLFRYGIGRYVVPIQGKHAGRTYASAAAATAAYDVSGETTSLYVFWDPESAVAIRFLGQYVRKDELRRIR